ncbi:MAG: hypothetical protein ACE5JX_04175 [Acidobacteriota bacterium]
MKRKQPLQFAVTATAAAALCIAAFFQEANAVPSFARKYRTSCQTCHVVYPQLNAFGRAFRNNGYRMPGDDQDYVKDEPTPLGAPAWKKVFPNAVWPADIPGGSVASFIVESNYTINNSEAVSNEFDGIDEIGLIFGGTAGESFSYFGDVDLFEEGGPGGIGRLFFQYNHPTGLFNFRAGQIEPRAVSFSNHRRLIRISNYLVDVFPTLPAQNFFGFSPNQRGIEVYGSKEGPGHQGGITWAFGLVNGEYGGAAEALGESGAVGELIAELEELKEEAGGEFDPNSRKDYYASVEYKIGGMGVLGGGSSDTLTESNNWVDNSVTLGAYYYNGTAPAIMEAGAAEEADMLSRGESPRHLLPAAGGATEESVYMPNGNHFFRAGIKADAFFHNLNIFGVLQLNDDDWQFGDRREFRSTLGMVEAHYVVYPWLIPAYRFENVNPTFGASFQRHSFNTSFLVRANAKLLIEFVKSQGDAPNLAPFDDRFRVGFNIAF